VGLSAGYFVRAENAYRKDWTSQKAFYWQLYWRAPAFKSGTALLSEGGIFQYVTQYSLATAINSLYPVPDGTTALPIWTFEMDNLDEAGMDAYSLQSGVDLTYKIRTLSFGTSSHNSVVISYQRDEPHCLWVVTPLDADNPYLQHFTAQSLAATNLDQILPQPSAATYPDPATFGQEPAHTWCYFFEKADLARQFGDWTTVTSLGDQAIAQDFGPGNSYEWIPFIEGYIHLKNLDQAAALTSAAYENAKILGPALCDAWTRSLSGMTLSPTEDAIVNQTMTALECGQ
jgi:hypothetical protein